MPKPIFSGDHKIQRRQNIWADFLECVLQMPWAFASDESCLQDFEGLMDSTELVRRVRARYGLELLDEHQAMPLYKFLDLLEPPPKT